MLQCYIVDYADGDTQTVTANSMSSACEIAYIPAVDIVCVRCDGKVENATGEEAGKPTPRPWRLITGGYAIGPDSLLITGRPVNSSEDTDEHHIVMHVNDLGAGPGKTMSKDDAELVVKCVNAYYGHVELIGDMLRWSIIPYDQRGLIPSFIIMGMGAALAADSPDMLARRAPKRKDEHGNERD